MRHLQFPHSFSFLPGLLAVLLLAFLTQFGTRNATAQGAYVVGPGDSFSLQLHGIPESRQEAIIVGADGTVSFLEARRIRVAGLTIAQARKRVEEALAVSVRSPRLIMNPVALGSKKYTILGMVGGNGTFPLDSEVTLIDAIARSGGIQDAAVDFERSFLSRGGMKVSVDMKRLYAGGDLSQNLRLRDGDYIYIASVIGKECYIFGAVGRGDMGGVIPLRQQQTVIGAITAAGGYSRNAWPNKVLIVRGSLDEPELIEVKTGDIIAAKTNDVLLQAGDIVYVHTKPWAVATDLLDLALRAFITSSISRSLDVGTSVGS